MELIDETKVLAPDLRALRVGQPTARLARDVHLAAVRVLEQAGDLEQGRLARAGRSDQRHHLAGRQDQLDPAQHLEPGIALAEAPLDPGQAQARLVVRTTRARLVPGGARCRLHS